MTPVEAPEQFISEPPPLRAGANLPRTTSVFATSFLISLFFLLTGPYSNFGAAGYLDPWFYTGYFTHFSYLLHHYGLTYYVSRLPWILPGVLVFKVATPAAASVILNALITASGLTAIYLGVTWHYGELPAALACIALMTNTYFMSAVAWDYPDGPAIAYAFLALAFFLRPTEGFIPNCAVGGAFLALSGYTNLAALPILVGILAVPFWQHKGSLRRLARSTWHIFLGGSAVTAIFAIIARPLLGLYQFYLPQVRMIRYTRDHPEYLENMWGTGYGWISVAFRLFPVVFVLLLGAMFVLVRRKRRPAFDAVYLCLSLTSALFCLLEFGLHDTGLRVSYTSSYLVCPVLMFAGIFLGEYLSDLPISGVDAAGHANGWSAPATEKILWTAVALFAGALPFIYAYYPPNSLSHAGLWARLFIYAGAAGALIALRRRNAILRAVACCLILAVLFYGPAYDTGLSNVWHRENASVFDSILKIESIVDAGITPDRAVMFWYDKRGPGYVAPQSLRIKPANLFSSAHSLYLFGDADLSRTIPAASVTEVKKLIQPNTTFVHLTMDSDETSERDRILASRGITVGNDRRSIIASPFGNIHVVLQDVVDESAVH